MKIRAESETKLKDWPHSFEIVGHVAKISVGYNPVWKGDTVHRTAWEAKEEAEERIVKVFENLFKNANG